MLFRLKHINRVRSKGRTYYYHRPSGTRIKSEYGSPEFILEVERLNSKIPQKSIQAGTLGALIAKYRNGPEWRDLAVRTRSDYQRIFDWLQPIEDRPLTEFSTPFIVKLRDKADASKKRRFANYLIQVMRLLFNWGRPRGECTANPAADVPLLKRSKDRKANRSWRPDEVETVLAALSPSLRLPVMIAAFTGLRLGDILRLPWSAYKDGAIEWRQGKTGDMVWIPVHSRLRAALEEAPRTSPIISTNSNGAPWTPNSLPSGFFKVIRRLTAEGKVSPGLTFHGLRHTVAVRLADAGADTRTIAAITGHADEAMVRVYTAGADQKRRAQAGMALLEKGTSAEHQLQNFSEKLQNFPEDDT